MKIPDWAETIEPFVGKFPVANGGDDCFFLKDYKIEFTSYLIRDLLIEEVKKEGNIKANNEERIKISKNGK